MHKYQKYSLWKMSETRKHAFDHNKLISLVGGRSKSWSVMVGKREGKKGGKRGESGGKFEGPMMSGKGSGRPLDW